MKRHPYITSMASTHFFLYFIKSQVKKLLHCLRSYRYCESITGAKQTNQDKKKSWNVRNLLDTPPHPIPYPPSSTSNVALPPRRRRLCTLKKVFQMGRSFLPTLTSLSFPSLLLLVHIFPSSSFSPSPFVFPSRPHSRNMRIQLSTTLLLIAATTINAAPTPHAPTTTDAIFDKLKVVYDQSEDSKDCLACVAALVTTKTLDRHNRSGVLKAFKRLCPTFQQQPADVVNVVSILKSR